MPGIRFVLTVLLAWNGVWWLVLGGLLAPVVPGGWFAIGAAACVLLLPIAVLVRAIGGAGYPSAATRLWILRPFWYGQLFGPLVAAAGLAGTLFGVPFGVPATGGRWAIGAAALVLTILAGWGYAGTRRLVVRRLDVAFPELPGGLDGVRIIQISDLHVGPHTSRRHLDRVVGAVRAAEPDLIVFTGDQVDDYARDMEPFAAALTGLSAPLGTYAIAGNHDIIAGWDAVRRGMERMGFAVLVNEAVPVTRGADRFWIAGAGDPTGHVWTRGGGAAAAPDVERALAEVPDGAFTIALAHNPALWPELASRGVDLTLSGHTHYGQFAIPRLAWCAASPFLELAMGVHRRGGSLLSIHPGTNYWGVPLRIGTPPEVAVLTLRTSTGAWPAATFGERQHGSRPRTRAA